MTENSKNKLKLFSTCYESMKFNLGINLEPKKIQEPLSNEVFHLLNPK
jgi:hypothetical protein